MYRIRSASGNEVSYNSLEEFSAAVRRGEVHPEDEIFHTRANRWLDVKSHPHYRSANTWQHHEPAAAATAPRAPGASGAAAPAPTRSASGGTSSNAQVFERPVIRSAPQTTVRPQLQPAAPQPEPAAPEPKAEAAVAPKPEVEAPRPRKSKELSFIDVGDVPGTKPMPSLMAPIAPPPVAPQPIEPQAPKAAAAPVPAPAAPAPIEPPAPPKVAAAPVPAPAPAPVPAPAPAPAPVTSVAKPAPAPAPVTSIAKSAPEAAPTPDTEAEFLVMDGGIESPVRTSTGSKTVPEDLGLLFDAPLPQNDGTPPRGAAADKPAKGSAAPRVSKPTSPPVSTPDSASKAADGKGEVDVEILPASLLEAPVPVIRPDAPASSSRSVLLGGGAAILLVAAGLLAWRPWKSSTAAAAETAKVAAPQPSAASAAPSTPSTRLAGPPAPTPIRTASAKVADSSAAASSTDSAGEDQIIAVKKPSFRTDIGVPAPTDFNVGAVTSSASIATPDELVRRLVAAERQAQQELNSRLAAAGFRNVLAPEHLNSGSGVGSARAAWSTGVDAIRQYRGRIARLESAYEDTVLGSQRTRRWSGDEMRTWASRPSLAEPTETSQLADLMFSQVSEGLEILAALSGEYSVKGQSITFKNTASATRYASIRGWVEQRTSTWAGTPESARPYSVTVILHALGDGFPAAQ